MRFLTFLFAIFLTASSCWAESEVVIQDTAGNVRAQSTLDENGQVEVELTDDTGAPIDGAELTLTNTVTGEVITDISAAGLVVFTNVTPGVWVVASTNAAVVISTVSVGTIAAVGAVGAAGAAGGIGLGSVGTGAVAAAAVAGGSVAVANANDSSNSDTPPLSPFQ